MNVHKMTDEELIEKVLHHKHYHMNPYNLGDMGETGMLIDEMCVRLQGSKPALSERSEPPTAVLGEADSTEKAASGCPCLYAEPCHPHCTCAKPMMSYGCRRCCTYGSIEQRREKAQRLISLERAAKTEAV